MRHRLALGLAGGFFAALMLGAFRCDYEAARVTERITVERVPEIRKLYTPLSPSAETCRAQGKQWVAWRNPDQWVWIRECVSADLSYHYRPTQRGSHGKASR